MADVTLAITPGIDSLDTDIKLQNVKSSAPCNNADVKSSNDEFDCDENCLRPTYRCIAILLCIASFTFLPIITIVLLYHSN